jgi:hypothetical protein
LLDEIKPVHDWVQGFLWLLDITDGDLADQAFFFEPNQSWLDLLADIAMADLKNTGRHRHRSPPFLGGAPACLV